MSIELNFKSFGEGPALIILHGLFGSLDNWQTLARRFGNDFSVFTLDMRNHGKSPWTDTFDYPSMAEDLETFMDQQGIYHANLLGHSMGGKVAMEFALENGGRIDKLVVADMAPVHYTPHHTAIFAALNALDLSKLKRREEADEVLKPGIPEAGVRQFLIKNILREKDGTLRWKFNLRVISDAYTDILQEISHEFPAEMPALFVHGGKSDYVKEEYKPGIMELFPEATFQQIEQAGHWLHAEAPMEFYDIVSSFLKD